MFDADLYAQSVLINKISASELSREFAKSALLVGDAGISFFLLLLTTLCSISFLFSHSLSIVYVYPF